MYRKRFLNKILLGNLRSITPWGSAQDNHLYDVVRFFIECKNYQNIPFAGVFWYNLSMKPWIKNLIAFTGMTILVFVLHVLATKMSFYYIFWWYDSMLHILGGMAVAFFGYMFLKGNREKFIPLLAVAVGVIWEVFERLGHIWWPGYIGFGGPWDTIFDVLCAILGALIIIIWQKNNTTRI